ncbi:MAG: hypothetical protein K0Q49_2569, partial [Haloplasmataceae bacterium]|nr:hypothetical protein [Haloplasmataceae bacterium]
MIKGDVMKKMFGLLVLCLLLILTGCSSAKEPSEKEKLESYLKTIGYDCGISHCKTNVEDNSTTVYLLDDAYTKSEHSYINLTNGIIKEGINFVDSFIMVGNETTTIIIWESNYTLSTQQYKVDYQYIEKDGESLITLA